MRCQRTTAYENSFSEDPVGAPLTAGFFSAYYSDKLQMKGGRGVQRAKALCLGARGHSPRLLPPSRRRRRRTRQKKLARTL